MNPFAERLQELSPERRALFEQLLRQKQTRRRAIPRLEHRLAHPPSFAQERLWILDLLEPGTSKYNCPCGLEMAGYLDVRALESHFNTLLARHESLRTRFKVTEAGPIQEVAETLDWSLPIVDLTGLPPSLRDSAVARLSKLEAQGPFHLEHGPLFRVSLLRRDETNHVALMTLHHIIADDRSMENFIVELSQCHRAWVLGEPLSLPDLPIQYLDFSVWQRQWLEGSVSGQQLDYWQQQLAELAMLKLPRDFPSDPTGNGVGAVEFFEIPSPLVRAFAQMGLRARTSMFMTMLASFHALLFRYTGQDDVAVGTPVANRNRRELEHLIGFFVNMLVMRARIEPGLGFENLLAQVRETTLAAFENQDLPFEKLVAAMRPEAGQGKNPLFQVMFVYLSAPAASLTLPGLTLTPSPKETIDPKFDLTLTLVEEGDGLSGSLEYDTNRFEPTTIRRLVGYYHHLLEAIVADPTLGIEQGSLLNDEERAHVLCAWNDTSVDYGKGTCLHQIFEQRADRHPDALALVMEAEKDPTGNHPPRYLTYAALESRANRFAHRLVGLGVRPEQRVGICMVRCPEATVAMLAILKAGGTYLSLDPGYPEERLSFMLQDADVNWWFLHGTAPKLSTGDTPTAIEMDQGQPDSAPPARLSLPVNPASPAYLIYTSGSTGWPKGVLGPHAATINRLNWMWRTYPFGPGEMACQKTFSGFVDSVWEQFGPLLAGTPSVILHEDSLRQPSRLTAILEAHGVTRILLVPVLFDALLTRWKQTPNPLPKLKHWVVSGEALSPELVQEFKNQLPGRVLLNLYGSSEVAADVTCFDSGDWHRIAAPVTPIGKPIHNTRIHLLDPHGQPVPPGVAGELVAGGLGLARGYLGQPALTASRFVPDPFCGETGGRPGDRLYKTGDLASYLADGNLLFLGRVDLQVQIHGHRIEPEEIETLLRRHPRVANALVHVTGEPRTRQLRAAVVPAETGGDPVKSDSDTPALARLLRDYLRKKLPAYMVPTEIVALKELPLLPNGKVNRHGLAGHLLGVTERKAFRTPKSATEQRLAEILMNVLQLEEVGLDDTIFDLGANSLHLVQIHLAINRAYPPGIKVQDLFDNPSLEALAVLVKGPENEPETPTHVIRHLDF